MRKRIALIIAILLLLALAAALQFWSPFKIQNQSFSSTPSPQPNQQPPAQQSEPRSQPEPPPPPASESLVSFSDSSSLQEFAQKNNLDASELEPVAELPNTYIVRKTPESLQNGGAQVAPRRTYHALLSPSDPLYPQWYTTSISAPAAWDVSTGSSSVITAVVDTGFALGHEDLAGRWAINNGESGGGKESNGLDDDSNGKVDDWRGWDFDSGDNDPSAGVTNPSSSSASHGTITSGLVGATGNNAKGVASLNWGTAILPLQALGDNGSGFTEDVVAAVNYAVSRGAKVISLSLGTGAPDPTLETAINNAIAAGVSVVAAAGNCGDSSYFLNGCSYQGQMVYPARYASVIAVGASDQNDQRAGFSSYGPELDLLAPGAGSIQAPTWSQANQTSLYTSSANGTSFSTPVVAGAIGLLRSVHTTLTPSDISTVLTSAVDKVADMNGANKTNEHGYGRLNAQKTVNLSGLSCPLNVATVANLGSTPTGEKILGNRLSSGSENLSIIYHNNTGTGCIEVHTLAGNLSQYIQHVATNRSAISPTDAEVIAADTNGDGVDELMSVEYQNTGSGMIEVHRWASGYQQWSAHIASNRPAINPANGDVISADRDGDGKDELYLIEYQNTASDKVEVHGWTANLQQWFLHAATIHDAVDPADNAVIAADTNGDGKDELLLVKYRNNGSSAIEIHGFSDNLQGWVSHIITNHSWLNPADNELINSNSNGSGPDEVMLIKYRGTDSGKMEVHGWTTGFNGWFLHAALP